jgi:hypothetical protein
MQSLSNACSESFVVHVFHETLARDLDGSRLGGGTAPRALQSSNIAQNEAGSLVYSNSDVVTKRRRMMEMTSILEAHLQSDGQGGPRDVDNSMAQSFSVPLKPTLLDALRAECDAAFHHRMQLASESRRRRKDQCEPVELAVGREKDDSACFSTTEPCSSEGTRHECDAVKGEDQDTAFRDWNMDESGGEDDGDLLDLACAIDLFEDAELSDTSPARSLPSAYWGLRSRASTVLGVSGAHQQAIKRAILEDIPTYIRPCVFDPLSSYESDRIKLYLFNEHYIVKPPFSSVRFGWHIDEEKQLGAISESTKYVSVWCPLDDVCGCNGSLVLPRSAVLQHWGVTPAGIHRMSERDAEQAASSGCSKCSSSSIPRSLHKISNTPGVAATRGEGGFHYGGQGVAIRCRAGSLVVFSSKMPHCSGPNESELPRRVFYAQYSDGVIGRSATEPLCFAVPV